MFADQATHATDAAAIKEADCAALALGEVLAISTMMAAAVTAMNRSTLACPNQMLRI